MTSIIPLSSAPATMSSREIAELTDKRHDNVMRDIETQLAPLLGDGGLLKFEDTYQNSQNGQSYRMYRLPKRECLIVVSGYSVELRARIIDRWMELEAQPSGSFDLAAMTSAALRELAAKVEEVATLKAAVITMQPKADFYDRTSPHVSTLSPGFSAPASRGTAATGLDSIPNRMGSASRAGS